MCHLILLLPIIGTIVFWIWPPSIAIPVYSVILVISGLFYYSIMKSMRLKVVTGTEELIGQDVEVINISGQDSQVRVHGEIWRAVSDDILHSGDTARILGVEKLTLIIAKESEQKPVLK